MVQRCFKVSFATPPAAMILTDQFFILFFATFADGHPDNIPVDLD